LVRIRVRVRVRIRVFDPFPILDRIWFLVPFPVSVRISVPKRAQVQEILNDGRNVILRGLFFLVLGLGPEPDMGPCLDLKKDFDMDPDLSPSSGLGHGSSPSPSLGFKEQRK